MCDGRWRRLAVMATCVAAALCIEVRITTSGHCGRARRAAHATAQITATEVHIHEPPSYEYCGA